MEVKCSTFTLWMNYVVVFCFLHIFQIFFFLRNTLSFTFRNINVYLCYKRDWQYLFVYFVVYIWINNIEITVCQSVVQPYLCAYLSRDPSYIYWTNTTLNTKIFKHSAWIGHFEEKYLRVQVSFVSCCFPAACSLFPYSKAALSNYKYIIFMFPGWMPNHIHVSPSLISHGKAMFSYEASAM